MGGFLSTRWCDEGGNDCDFPDAGSELLPGLKIPDREAHGVRAVRCILVDRLLADVIYSITEIPVVEEGNAWGAPILELWGEEDGFGGLLGCHNLDAAHEVPAFLCGVCGEHSETLLDGESAFAKSMDDDGALCEGGCKPEVERSTGGLEERPLILDVIGEVIVIVRIFCCIEVDG